MRRNATVAGWAICLLTLLVVAATVVLTILNAPSLTGWEQVNLIETVLPTAYAILGGLVVSQQPRNALGWIFLAIAFLNAIPGTTNQYAIYALLTQPTAPFSPWIPWLGYVTSTLVYPAGLACMALALIPNGRLLSPRWVIVVWAGWLVTAYGQLVAMIDPDMIQLPGFAGRNPTGIRGFEGINQGLPGTVAFLAGLLMLAVAAASLVIRFRRARGDERLQLRWIALGTAFAVISNTLYTVISLLFLSHQALAQLSPAVVIAGFGLAMPAGFAFAILRYRLYDLDLFLNRTILYGTVTVILLAIFGLVDLLAQQAIQAMFDTRSELLALGLGLVAGLAFGPVRRWLRPVVDRVLPARSRLTLLFTDIVESTQAIVDLGDERWRELLDRYRSAVRQLLSRHRGREVNTAGDAFFAVFDRPANAVRCAEEMRVAVGELGLRVRTGLHVGDVEMRGEQVTGLAVHAAARIMGRAEAGEIVVSESLAALLPPETSLRDVGRSQLRGVPGEWQLYDLA
ncbi:MAG TPA: adenylate/guanylate cyclase domain-containing protein [Candidatus Limnocylindria bacterium]